MIDWVRHRTILAGMGMERPNRESVTEVAHVADVVVSGDQLGFLYRRYSDALRRYVARNFGAGAPDPDDVVQAVFEKYANSAGQTPIANVRAFLFRSARNHVIDEHRRRSVRAEYEREQALIADESDQIDSQRVLESKERLTMIESAIATLDARSREFLIMNRIQGLSCAEIARRKQCSATLVKTCVARALVQCYRALGEERG